MADSAPSPTPHTSGDKRDRILDAALVLFAERGFHGTPVPMVAEHAKVGAGTIYRYFASKEALVNALYQREKHAILDHVLREFPFHFAPRPQFNHFFRAILQYAEDRRDSFRFLEHHYHSAYLDSTSREIERRVITLASAYFVETARQQVTKAVAPEVLMAVVWGTIVHLMKDVWSGRLELSEPILVQAEEVCWEAVRR